ncbi:MAG: hypothetical protein KatS3mg057_0809 [Herpetosiphonaceae bacterium]|nr:MAG: hypothetical protein KatS3mg057_0809 [Herpetosiphonaceae bacterium]
MVKGASTKRSDLSAETLIADLRAQAIDHLAKTLKNALWLIGDGSALRKPSARALPALMNVRALEGAGVPSP